MSDESFDSAPKTGRGRKARSGASPAPRRPAEGEQDMDYRPRPARDTRERRPRAARSTARKAVGRPAARVGSINKLLRNKVFWQFAAVAALLLIVVVPVIAELLQSRVTAPVGDPVSMGNAYYDQALALLDKGDTDGAVSAFRQAASAYERALLQDPQNVQVRTDLGAVYYYQGRLLGDASLVERSVAAWQTVLAQDPNKVEALFNLGLAYAIMGRVDQAVASWQRVIELAPGTQSAQDAQEMILRYTSTLTSTSVPAGP